MKETAELWKKYNISSELLKQRLGRTSNLLGEYAEYLVSEYLKGELLTASNASADIQTPNGDFYQVKSRKISSNLTTQLSIIRSWNFDYLAVILFNKKGSVIKGLICSKSISEKYGTYNEHQNGWVISTTNSFLNDKTHIDITNQLRELNNEKPIELEKSLPSSNSIRKSDKTEYSTFNQKEREIDKVDRKLPKWFKNPDFICSRILIIFLELEKKYGSVKYDLLADYCSGMKTFKSNFAQMKNFGEKNHGKVFEQNGSIITLWNPIKEKVILEFDKHYELIKTHYITVGNNVDKLRNYQ
ncbi:hypothetical protein [Zobellia sp. 1_MG-2023]|uniref:hypothetical protein n=1 Tax=Zobellia sp. 1_MG-2023 TaxID=3062626 RepID=UPI0026E23469|nr:hypothetical protein [Zobellia sp. 1_MG-2023]MDO6819627.1 hypothetical protein [Zobellia sp. 1_MG-2023]